MRTVYPFELDTCYEAYTSYYGHTKYFTIKFSNNSHNVLVMQCVPYVQTRFDGEGIHNPDEFEPILDFSDDNMLRTRNLYVNQPLQLTTVVDPMMKAFSRRKPKVLYVYRCPRNTSDVSHLPLILNGSLPCTKLRFTPGY